MEKILSLEYGVGGVCVLLTLMVLLKVGEFLWKMRERKDTLSETAIQDLTAAVESSTRAMQHLDLRLQHMEKSIAELPKFKTDIRRFYSAIKEVAGEKWPAIRDEIMKDEFTL